MVDRLPYRCTQKTKICCLFFLRIGFHDSAAQTYFAIRSTPPASVSRLRDHSLLSVEYPWLCIVIRLFVSGLFVLATSRGGQSYHFPPNPYANSYAPSTSRVKFEPWYRWAVSTVGDGNTMARSIFRARCVHSSSCGTGVWHRHCTTPKASSKQTCMWPRCKIKPATPKINHQKKVVPKRSHTKMKIRCHRKSIVVPPPSVEMAHRQKSPKRCAVRRRDEGPGARFAEGSDSTVSKSTEKLSTAVVQLWTI